MSRKISYFYDPEVGNYSYGLSHPMKPHRIRLTHELILSYGIQNRLTSYIPPTLETSELLKFHSDDYIHFLELLTPENSSNYLRECHRFNIDSDSPVFTGIFDFCKSYTSASLSCARLINRKISDIAINWSGGLHHAKRAEASGFCYINDIVLCIAELLKRHKRVLYIDIDVHHGDGVEEAFYLCDRVLTLSLHRYGDFFPGTGHLEDIGAESGKHYSLNVPLKEGIGDENYITLFEPILDRTLQKFRPEVIVLQCGTDSLAHDRLGCFNLSSKGHSECVKYVKEKGLPLIVLGGGGYTVRNVARCWALETSVLVGMDLSQNFASSDFLRTSNSEENYSLVEMGSGSVGSVGIPHHDYYDYYAPDFELEVKELEMIDKNEKEEIDEIMKCIYKELELVETASNSGYGFDYVARSSNNDNGKVIGGKSEEGNIEKLKEIKFLDESNNDLNKEEKVDLEKCGVERDGKRMKLWDRDNE